MAYMRLLWVSAAISVVISVLCAYATNAFLNEPVHIVGSFIGFYRSYNTGVAFGLQLPPVLQEILIGLALILVAVFAARTAQSSTEKVGFGFILGGGLANIIDRIGDGAVTDMIRVGTFPIFNIADSFITIGVMFLFAEILLSKRP